MKNHEETSKKHDTHRAPGEIRDCIRHAVMIYSIGLIIAAGMTAIAFWIATSEQFWHPSVVVWLGVLAIAQVVVHLVFFFHLSTGPNSSDNLMVVIFGMLIVFILGVGTIWIMNNLNANMEMPMKMKMEIEGMMKK
ncbi:cytochrome o ubiquinol oxidase subunit IV [Akkermansiaceae bacterium]|nr:cytochrome o ubiquinol oxidase subunit IV [Akkermansiaceae bacterium]